MLEKGNISIHAENILPIIKKWLYSEKEIFLREIVSNAADAISKLARLDIMKEVPGGAPEARIEILIDKEKKQLEIVDTGIGMSAEEIKKYINQVAFSGLHDFIEKYQDKDSQHQVIGHFGLGFYSAFMVADKIEIDSLSYQEGAQAAHWSCDGSTEFEMSESKREKVGTSIILHINEESKDLLEAVRLRTILMKYCAFMKYPIMLEGKLVNDPNPIWNKTPSQLTEKNYTDFFRKLFPTSPDPLFYIHINLEMPFQLNGILYFPKLQHELDASQGEVKLYSNQVYIVDNAKEMIPEFLTLLKGALDVADLPLNVSRSALQNDPQVQKISQHIVKKVADRLIGLAKTERENYERFWPDIHPFVKYGMMRDQKFYDRLIDYLIFKTISGKYVTLDDYLKEMKEQTDGAIIYVNDVHAQSAYVNMFQEHGMDAIITDTLIDQHFFPYIEMRSAQKYKFKRIDVDLSKNLIDKEGASKIIDPKDNKSESDKIADIFQNNIAVKKVKIRVENLKTSKIPAMLIFDEQKLRFREMSQKMMKTQSTELSEEDHTLVVNQSSPAIKKLLQISNHISKIDEVKMMVDQIYDLAYIQQGAFNADHMQKFIMRSSTLLEKIGEI